MCNSYISTYTYVLVSRLHVLRTCCFRVSVLCSVVSCHIHVPWLCPYFVGLLGCVYWITISYLCKGNEKNEFSNTYVSSVSDIFVPLLLPFTFGFSSYLGISYHEGQAWLPRCVGFACLTFEVNYIGFRKQLFLIFFMKLRGLLLFLLF